MQIEFIANVTKLYRDESPTFEYTDKKEFIKQFPNLKYKDIKGLCKITDIREIEKEAWSLSAGRYVGIANAEKEEYVFEEKLVELNNELSRLNVEAQKLEKVISNNIKTFLRN